jgi:hypothetical protein
MNTNGFEHANADEQSDLYGIISDLDRLEEMLEELDDLQLTTRDEVAARIIAVDAGKGSPAQASTMPRLEQLLADLDEFDLTSREDIVARITALDGAAEDIEAHEEQEYT